jgi:hypothetical protein
MSIVRRKDSAGRTYYFNNNTGKRTTEEAWKRSHTDSKRSKTQFKTAKQYVCESAARTMGKRPKNTGSAPTRASSSAGRTLRTKCQKTR